MSGLTGFQLFVVWALLDIAGWQAEARWERDKKWASLVTFLTNGLASTGVAIYWLVVAVAPQVFK